MAQYTIAVDAMGGDNAPDALIEGISQAQAEDASLRVLLTGPEDLLSAKLAEAEIDASRVEIVHAPGIIDMHDAPVQAVRKKKDASMVVACDLIGQGRAQAALSAGSTGALLAAGIFVVGRVKGIARPALAAVLPTVNDKPVVLLDVGANADCQPQHIVGFGLLGKAYARSVLRREEPRVALLNIGAEAEKGNMLYKAVYPLMESGPFAFAGNCEARDLLSGEQDVVVADGFTGNIALKLVEGTAMAMADMLKESLMRTPRGKIGALLAKPGLRAFRDRMDYSQYGGAPLLGLEGVVVKAHGSSDATAIKNALHQAADMAAGDLPAIIREGASALNTEET